MYTESMNQKGVKTLLNKDPDFFKKMRAKRTTPGKFATEPGLAKRAADIRWGNVKNENPKEQNTQSDSQG